MHLYRACAAALVAALVSAPLAAQRSRNSEPAPRVEETANGFSIRINSQVAAIEKQIAAPADSVWAALPEVLRELGIAPQVSAGRDRVIGNQRITARRVAGDRTDIYVRCGNEGAGASAMSAMRIRLSLLTTVRPEGDTRSRLFTEVTGTANPVEGTGGTILCASTGALEQKLAEAVAARVVR
jgi:hypothetical protein